LNGLQPVRQGISWSWWTTAQLVFLTAQLGQKINIAVTVDGKNLFEVQHPYEDLIDDSAPDIQPRSGTGRDLGTKPCVEQSQLNPRYVSFETLL
jgi:hypothetical protein